MMTARPLATRARSLSTTRRYTIANHPTRDLLMIYKVEAPGKQAQFTYEKATWNYNTRKQAYELIASFDINLPLGISEEDIKNNQAKLSVLIVAGGDSFDPQTKHLKVVGISKAATTDVTKTRQAVGPGGIANEVDLPVPYASGWITLTYNRTENSQRVFRPSGVIALKPQGVLLTTTIRNNSEQDMQYSGFTLRSNALQFDGEIDLSQASLRRSDGMTPSGFSIQDYFVNTGNKWISNAMCSRDYTPSTRRLLPTTATGLCKKGGALSEDVIVFWAMPVKGIETATDYTQSIGNTYRPAIGYAQTHIYANGVKSTTGAEITAPNYTIAPVMGTDKRLSSARLTRSMLSSTRSPSRLWATCSRNTSELIPTRSGSLTTRRTWTSPSYRISESRSTVSKMGAVPIRAS